MRRTIVVLVAMMCFVSVTAFAEQLNNYTTIKLGIYSPESSDLKDDFRNGFNGEIAFGHYWASFYPNLVYEIAVGYFQTDTGQVTDAGVTGKAKITVIPVTWTAKGVYPLGKGEFYGGGGIAVYFAKTKLDISGGPSLSDKDTPFGAHILAGGNYYLTPNIFLGAEVKYLWAKARFQVTSNGNPVDLSAKLDGITGTVNLGYRF